MQETSKNEIHQIFLGGAWALEPTQVYTYAYTSVNTVKALT